MFAHVHVGAVWPCAFLDDATTAILLTIKALTSILQVRMRRRMHVMTEVAMDHPDHQTARDRDSDEPPISAKDHR